MKSKATLRSFLILAGSTLLTATFSHAVDGNWAVDNAGNWSDATKWSSDPDVPGTAAGDVIGLNNNIGAARTVTIDTTSRTAGILNIGDSNNTHTFTLAASGGATLTFDNSTAGAQINVGGSVTDNISAALVLADALKITTSAGTLSITGGVTTDGNTMTVEGAGNTSFTATANIITGTGGITKNGTGLLILGGAGTTPAHNYSGPTVINGGIVMSQNNLSANSNYKLTDAMFSDYYQTTTIFTGLGTGAKGIQIYGASGFGGGNGNSNWRIGALNSVLTWGTFEENGNTNATGDFNPTTLKLRSPADNNGTSIWGQVSLQNRLDLNSGARMVDVLLGSGNIGNSRATISNGIQDTGAAGSLTKTGGGMLTFGVNTSTWGGTTNVSEGLLDFVGTDENNIGGGTDRNITVAAGAIVRFNALSNAILNRIVETTDEIGVMTGTTGNSFDFSSTTGATLPNAFLGNWAGNGAKAEISGLITPGSNGYKIGAKGSSGLLGIRDTLSGANSLTVGMTGSSGLRVNIVAANTHTGETVINTGSRLTLGNNLALQNSPLNVGAAGGNFSLAAGTNAGRITGETAASSPTLGGVIGSRNLYSVFSSAVGNNETNLANTAVTGFTLNVGTGLTHTYSGAIGGFGTGAGTGGAAGTLGNSTLTKTGEGTQILSGTHTYTGATTISGGTLSLGATGSIASSASLSIGAGATLDASGQATYTVPASQPLTFGLDPAGSGSSGTIMAAGLDITTAAVTLDPIATLDDAVYVLANYTSLTGTAFAAPLPTVPSGYILDYAYQGNKIALVPSGGDVTAPTLVSIVDDVVGGAVNIGQTVVYTVTFDEDMDDTTVAADDFGNYGSAGVSIGTVTETTPGVFAVPVTTNSPGSLILRINLNAVLKDVAGNALDTDPALLDDTTITVRNAYQTWALTNAIGSAPGEDKDGDGVTNAVEFLLGGDVTTNDLAKLPKVTTPGADMVVTFQRKRSTLDTITGLVIEVGTTLASWPDLYTVGTNTGNSTPGVTVTENSPAGFDTITLTVPRSPDANQFARLSVVVTP